MTELPKRVRRLMRDNRGASAVEFAIVAFPFLLLLMGILQIGIFYIAQSALDTGTIATAELLNRNFRTGTSAVLPSGSTLKSNVVSNGGGMLFNNSTLSVEIRQLATLVAAPTAIVDGTTDYGTTTSTLVVRGQATVPTLAPGLSGLSTIRSSAMVRRQGT